MSVVKNSRSWPLKKNRWKELAPLLSNQTNRKKCVKRIFFLDYFQFLYAILWDMVKYFRSSVNPLTLRLKSNFPPDIYLVPIQLVIQVNYKIKWLGAFRFVLCVIWSFSNRNILFSIFFFSWVRMLSPYFMRYDILLYHYYSYVVLRLCLSFL